MTAFILSFLVKRTGVIGSWTSSGTYQDIDCFDAS